MTRFRVPAASILTLLLVAANLLSQTVTPRVLHEQEYSPNRVYRQLPDFVPVHAFRPTQDTPAVELEVHQLPLGTSMPCVSFQPVAAANYLLSWTNLWKQGRYCEAEVAAKEACDAHPGSLAAKHALVVSQIINSLCSEGTKSAVEKQVIRITCEVNCGGSFVKALEACCKPFVKFVCTPCSPAHGCSGCPAVTAQAKSVEAAVCCNEAVKVAATTAAHTAGCACGEKCACAKKTCKCGEDCACKEEGKKAQKRALRRELRAVFGLPPHVDGELPLPPGLDAFLKRYQHLDLNGDVPLPRGPAPIFTPLTPPPPPAFPPNPVYMPYVGALPLPAPPAVGYAMPAPPVCCPHATGREQIIPAEEYPAIRQARFTSAPRARASGQVHMELAGLKVQCDRLVGLPDGRIECEGNACLTIHRGNHPNKILAPHIVINPTDGTFEVGVPQTFFGPGGNHE